MKKYQYALLAVSFIGVFSGCVAEEKKELIEQKTAQAEKTVEQKEAAVEKNNEAVAYDFKRAVQTSVRNMTQSGVLDNPSGNRYTISISSIVDTTKKGFDTEAIKQNLSADLASGRKVRVVSASSKSVTPQMFVAGRITQRTAYVRSGKRQEYYLHLVLTEAKSGIKLWDNTTPVVKKKKKTANAKK